MSSGGEALVWRALANPVRRRILDLLRGNPRSTGELAAAFPELSRFAVMQHLTVLTEARLILARRQGRTRVNHLNAVPLRRIYERWVSRYADEAAAGALALQRYVEGEEPPMTVVHEDVARVVRIENEIDLKAPKERVFAAMTTESASWYPHTYGGERLKRIVFEERVGGQTYEDWGDGRGIMYGVVTYYDPPKMVATRGFLRGGITLETWYTVEERKGGSVLKQSMSVFGPISDEMLEGIRHHGDLSNYEDLLRAYVERTA